MMPAVLVLALGAALAQTVTLGVHVEWPDGTAVPGALVEVHASHPEAQRALWACNGHVGCAERALSVGHSRALVTRPAPLAQATATYNGEATLVVPTGLLHLTARSGDWAAVARVDARASTSPRLVLLPPRRYPVTVLQHGRPAAGAVVGAYTRALHVVDVVTTDAQGRAMVSGPSLYSAAVQHGEHLTVLDAWNVPVVLPVPRLCGEVLEDGVAAAGAWVHAGSAVAPIQADVRGQFCVEAREDGAPLWASHQDKASPPPMFFSAARLAHVRLHLLPGVSFSGVVLDQDGKPVAGARVAVEHPDDETPTQRVLMVLDADAQGRFVARGLPRVTLQVRVDAPGMESTTARVTLGTPTAVVMRRLFPLEVAVVRGGAPVPFAFVTAELLPDAAVSNAAHTDRLGLVTLWMPQGRYAVTVGETAAATRVTVPAPNAVTLEARKRLVEIAVVRGKDPVGQAVLEQADTGADLDTTAGDGRVFLWTGPDAVLTRVRAPGADVLVPIPPEAKATVMPLRARVGPARQLPVAVTRKDGTALADAQVYTQDGADHVLVFAGLTDASGKLTVALPRGPGAALKTFLPLERLFSSVPVDPDDDAMEVRLISEGTDVLVLDEQDRPIPEVWKLGVGPIPAPQGRVRAVISGSPMAPEPDVLVPGMEPVVEPGSPLKVRFAPCGYLVGATVDANGTPVRAPLEAARPGGRPLARGSSAVNGYFRLGCLPVGTTEVRSPMLGARSSWEIPAGTVGGPVVLTLANTRWINVFTAPGAEVQARDPRTDTERARTVANAEGHARLGPLWDGQHVILAESPRGARLARVELQGDAGTRLDLPLDVTPASVTFVLPPSVKLERVLMQQMDVEGGPLALGQPSPDGRVRVASLMPGPYWVEMRVAWAGGGEVLRSAIHVDGGLRRWTVRPHGRALSLVPYTSADEGE